MSIMIQFFLWGIFIFSFSLQSMEKPLPIKEVADFLDSLKKCETHAFKTKKVEDFLVDTLCKKNKQMINAVLPAIDVSIFVLYPQRLDELILMADENSLKAYIQKNKSLIQSSLDDRYSLFYSAVKQEKSAIVRYLLEEKIVPQSSVYRSFGFCSSEMRSLLDSFKQDPFVDQCDNAIEILNTQKIYRCYSRNVNFSNDLKNSIIFLSEISDKILQNEALKIRIKNISFIHADTVADTWKNDSDVMNGMNCLMKFNDDFRLITDSKEVSSRVRLKEVSLDRIYTGSGFDIYFNNVCNTFNRPHADKKERDILLGKIEDALIKLIANIYKRSGKKFLLEQIDEENLLSIFERLDKVRQARGAEVVMYERDNYNKWKQRLVEKEYNQHIFIRNVVAMLLVGGIGLVVFYKMLLFVLR